MIMLLDTSSEVCKLTFIVDEIEHHHEWLAARQLAQGLLAFIEQSLAKHEMILDDVTAIGIYRGPGSYTGLRIGVTVANTLAEALQIPIVGATGDSWQKAALERLDVGENDRIVLPEYGGEAHITAPRK